MGPAGNGRGAAALLRPRYAGAAVVLLVLVAIALVAGRDSQETPPAAPSAGAPALTRAPGGTPRGTMILVHGGAWRGPDSREQARLLRRPGDLLLRHRWRVVSVDYRQGKHGLRDVLAAVERLAPHRGEAPLCLYGESAGGQLALVAAARRQSVDCVIAAGAPTDFQAYFARAATAAEPLQRQVADLIRRIFGTTPQATAPWEPVRLARRIDADVLLLRAANDPLIPPEQMRRFRSVRPSTRSVELEGGRTHPWVHASLSARGEKVLRSTLAAFVDRAAAAR